MIILEETAIIYVGHQELRAELEIEFDVIADGIGKFEYWGTTLSEILRETKISKYDIIAVYYLDGDEEVPVEITKTIRREIKEWVNGNREDLEQKAYQMWETYGS